jgi:FSR family fosmidomycin resistance protein-like MFS transporter
MPPLSYFKKSLFLLWTIHFFVDFCTGLWPIYKTIAHFDVALAGLIAGIAGFIGEGFQLVFGNLCDRGHRKKILFLGACLASSILWITFCQSIVQSFFVVLCLMLGSGAFHPAAVGIAGSLSKIYKGRAILFFASGGAVGLGVSQLIFIRLIHHFNGHALIVLAPLLGVFLWLLFHRFPDIKTVPMTFSLKQLPKPLFFLYFAQVGVQALVMSFTFLLPDLLVERGCHSWLCLGGGHFCFISGSALAMIPAGFLCDRFGQRNVLVTLLLAAGAALYFFLVNDTFSLFTTGALLGVLGSFIGILSPIIVSWGHRLVPDSPSTVSALLMGFAWCVGNLSPTLTGLLAKAWGYPFAFGVMGLSIFVILLFIIRVPRIHPAVLNN